MSDETDEDSQLSHPESLVLEYEKSLISMDDLLEVVLTDNLVANDYNVRRTTVILGLENAISTEIKSEDTHDLAHAFLHILGLIDPDYLEKLRDAGASKELLQMLAKFSSKFGVESTIPNLVEYQGKRFWRDIYVEIVKRPTVGAIGMNYYLEGPGGKEIEISTDLQSNLSLIANFLQAQNDATDAFPDEAEEQTSLELIRSVKNELGELENQINELGNEPEVENNVQS